MKKRIHVNQHNIRANAKDGGSRPVLTVKTYKGNTLGDQVQVLGPSTLIYRPEQPLSCGARVWIETEAEVHVFKYPCEGPVVLD
jgi:hypothetical protein